ncbi:MAG: hypothetical protein AVDCRST_MAG88-2604 [uncultured Thermomicrobiales bacterium]|uniref:Uncharacterized protein n=1 Tax=uncultured Thermomicrobiales bacterium TaxID=1645740 RepID=A0A6J4VAY9_9BACT|nr:MAG: hypothetical protein AVDCRST_MAG88-2604 [uncultured Thermomicrobiales bacterium]
MSRTQVSIRAWLEVNGGRPRPARRGVGARAGRARTARALSTPRAIAQIGGLRAAR